MRGDSDRHSAIEVSPSLYIEGGLFNDQTNEDMSKKPGINLGKLGDYEAKLILWDITKNSAVVVLKFGPNDFKEELYDLDALATWYNSQHPDGLDLMGHIESINEEKEQGVTTIRAALTSFAEDAARKSRRFTATSIRAVSPERIETGEITEPTIMDGGGVKTLAKTVRPFKTPYDIQGAASTSLAGDQYKQGGEDAKNKGRVYINPNTGHVVVIDGLEGVPHGYFASDLLARTIESSDDNIQSAARAAQLGLSKEDVITEQDGARFLSVKLKTGHPIEVYQSGHVNLYHFGPRGELKYKPGKQLEINQPAHSAFEYLDFLSNSRFNPQQVYEQIRHWGDASYEEAIMDIARRVSEGRKPFVKTNHPLFEYLRDMVMQAVTKDNAQISQFSTQSTLEKGDLVLILSKGASDVFSLEEIERSISPMIAMNWDVEKINEALSKQVDERMQQGANDSTIALNNASIAVMRA